MASAIYQPASGSNNKVDVSKSTQGLIISHSEYDEKYERDINATLKLVGINHQTLTLTFLKFDLEDKNCKDYLNVSHGSMTERFCGKDCKDNGQCRREFFAVDAIILHFVSDSHMKKKGFLLLYSGKKFSIA